MSSDWAPYNLGPIRPAGAVDTTSSVPIPSYLLILSLELIFNQKSLCKHTEYINNPHPEKQKSSGKIFQLENKL